MTIMPTALSIVQRYYPQVKTITDAKREKDYDGAVISVAISYLIRGDRAMRYRTPSSVAREIVSFDRHADFTPGRYALAVPTAYHHKLLAPNGTHKLGGKPGSHAGKKKSPRPEEADTMLSHRTMNVRAL
jgi:hypothetical protein